MNFEWDESKNKLNIAKHGIDFNMAKRIFDGVVLTVFDDRQDYGEDREVSIGMVGGVLILVVVHTERASGIIRLISARRATKSERRKYESYL